jgi:hypothetical protein
MACGPSNGVYETINVPFYFDLQPQGSLMPVGFSLRKPAPAYQQPAPTYQAPQSTYQNQFSNPYQSISPHPFSGFPQIKAVHIAEANKMKTYIAALSLVSASASFAQMPIPMQIQGIQLPNTLQMMQQAEQIRAIQLQNEQAAYQLRQMEEQRRAREQQAQRAQQASAQDPVIDEWLRVAGPRMSLYPDFEQVVFARDVTITNEMIRLMAASPLAADIAYYFGTHKIESLAVSKMNPLEAAKTISQIEQQLMQKQKKIKTLALSTLTTGQPAWPKGGLNG